MDGTQANQLSRDDRVLGVTRVVSAVIVPVLSAAFVILFLFPGRTRELWAWTIASQMSAMFMGAGYLAGAVFFLRAARAREWHRLGPGIVATTAFATILGAVTFLHWDAFNHDHVSFWAWLVLYIATPLLLPLLYVRNRRYDPGPHPGPDDVQVPQAIRAAVALLGAAQMVFALLLLARPSLFLDRWPWPLTTLTARGLAGFAAFPAVTFLAFAVERRWSALRWPFETAVIGVALVGIAGLRATAEFEGDGGGVVWAWRTGLLLTLACLGGIWLALQGRARQPARTPDAMVESAPRGRWARREGGDVGQAIGGDDRRGGRRDERGGTRHQRGAGSRRGHRVRHRPEQSR